MDQLPPPITSFDPNSLPPPITGFFGNDSPPQLPPPDLPPDAMPVFLPLAPSQFPTLPETPILPFLPAPVLKRPSAIDHSTSPPVFLPDPDRPHDIPPSDLPPQTPPNLPNSPMMSPITSPRLAKPLPIARPSSSRERDHSGSSAEDKKPEPPKREKPLPPERPKPKPNTPINITVESPEKDDEIKEEPLRPRRPSSESPLVPLVPLAPKQSRGEATTTESEDPTISPRSAAKKSFLPTATASREEREKLIIGNINRSNTASSTPISTKISTSNTAQSESKLNLNKNRTVPITLEEFQLLYPIQEAKIDFKVFDKVRDKLVMEFLSTEQTYVTNLRIMKDFFQPAIMYLKPPDDEEEDPSLVKLKQTLIPLFKTVTEILAVNEMLLHDLTQRVASWSNEQQIGDAGLKIVQFFKMYGNYSRVYNDCIAAMEVAEAKSKLYKELLVELVQEPLCKCLPFAGYLIQPIQRLPRYVMLLSELIKTTSEDHVDYKDLCALLGKFKEKANEVNESINQAENQRKCLKIQKLFGTTTGDLQIVEPHRMFLLEGNIVKQCRKAKKHRRFFLFNDILIYGFDTPETAYNGTIVFSQGLKLSTMTVTDVNLSHALGASAESVEEERVIAIASPGKSFFMYCETDEEKKIWFTTLSAAIFEEKKKKSIVEESVSNAPVWSADKLNPNCKICTEKFTFYFRKHHCRNCGDCVCSNCSNYKMLLPHVSKVKERVCSKCFLKNGGK